MSITLDLETTADSIEQNKVLIDRDLAERLQKYLRHQLAYGDLDLLFMKTELSRALTNKPKFVGKILTESEMVSGYDRRGGNIIWINKPKSGLLFCLTDTTQNV